MGYEWTGDEFEGIWDSLDQEVVDGFFGGDVAGCRGASLVETLGRLHRPSRVAILFVANGS